MKFIFQYSLLLFSYFLVILPNYGQEKPKKIIEIVHGGTLTIDNTKYKGATIFNSDNQQVQFRHQGIDIWCDLAIFYDQQNRLQAYGNVYLQQGDSLKMNSNYLAYDGNTKMAIAKENVELRNNKMKLNTQELFFDRNTQEAYYNQSGTITDEENVLTSKEGRYFIIPEKNQFTTKVTITNPDFTLDSDQLDYYQNTGNAYLYGPSHIVGKEYKIYCEKGFYNTKEEKGNFRDNAKIDYDFKTLEGDSLYFENKTGFASATNNIRITDTINKVRVTGHYAEVFKQQDSMFITKKALLTTLIEKDSMFVHAKKIMVTGKEKERIIRAFPDARMFKEDMQGKCDSIHSSEQTGITRLIGNPVLWNGENQVTGDSIQLIANVKTEKMDSLKVINNTFIIEKDTLGSGYNQVKGKLMLGKFQDDKLKRLTLYQNTETIYYAYTEKKELVGINKLICSRIKLELDNNQDIETISLYKYPAGKLYPESELPENARKLSGFIWRGEERIEKKEDIFNEQEKEMQPSVLETPKTSEEIDEKERLLKEENKLKEEE